MGMKRASAIARTSTLLLLICSMLMLGVGPAAAEDTQEPVFQNISVSPANGSPGSVITVTISASDNVGISSGIVGYESPTTGATKYVFLDYSSVTGKLSGSLTIDRYDPPGVWKAVYVEILDTSLNIFAATADEVDLSAANLNVSNPSPDITPPVFSGLTVSTTKTNPGGKVAVSIKAADTESGLASAQVTWRQGWNSIVAFLLFDADKSLLDGNLFVSIDQATGAYALDTIAVFDQQGNEFKWDAAAGSPITGKNLEVSDSASAPVAGFKDVHPGDWFAAELLFLVEYDILGGYAGGIFLPKNNVTRAEFAKMVCKAAGWEIVKPAATSFGDVPADHWAFGYIETAKARGVIGGYPGGVFRPAANITRAEICKMLVSASNLQPDTSGASFNDVASDHWAHPYIITARNYEFVRGYAGNLFMPSALATRAEAAKMIYNSYENLGM